MDCEHLLGELGDEELVGRQGLEAEIGRGLNGKVLDVGGAQHRRGSRDRSGEYVPITLIR